MHRRDALRLIGTAAAIPVFSGLDAERLWAIGQGAHARSGAGSAGVLNPHQLETVGTIAEHIIPRTDTPGARDAGVPEFVDLLVAEWYDEAERIRFVQGLAMIDARSREVAEREFVALAMADQLSVLQSLDGAPARGPATAEEAYATIKSLTIYGYFTSQIVATTVLKVNVFPGRYDGCVTA
jgi:gluconate 2-dehydrogenase gamma chain